MVYCAHTFSDPNQYIFVSFSLYPLLAIQCIFHFTSVKIVESQFEITKDNPRKTPKPFTMSRANDTPAQLNKWIGTKAGVAQDLTSPIETRDMGMDCTEAGEIINFASNLGVYCSFFKGSSLR